MPSDGAADADRPCVLLLSGASGVGQNVLAALAGRRGGLHVAALNSTACDPAVFDFDEVFLAPNLAEDGFARKFDEALARLRPQLIVPCRDADVAWMAARAEAGRPHGTAFLCGAPGPALAMLDKAESAAFSSRHGLPYAPTLATADAGPAELAAFAARHGFPLVAKPREGFASGGVFFVGDGAQLARLAGRPGYVVQRFLGDPAPLRSYLARVADEGVPLFHSFEADKHSIQVFIAPDGSIVGMIATRHAMRQGKSERVERGADPALLDLGERCAAAFAAEGWRGPLNVQCVRDPGTPGGYGIHEYSGRYTGATAARALLGYDEVAMGLELFGGIAIPGLRGSGRCGWPDDVRRQPASRAVEGVWVEALQRTGHWMRPEPEATRMPIAMDAALEALAKFAAEAAVPAEDVLRARWHVLDALGCAVAALDRRAGELCAALAADGDGGASFAIGCDRRLPCELAAFVNAGLARHLDFNDTGIGGHPSDVLGALLAAASSIKCDGRALLEALAVAYEVQAGLRRGGMRLRDRHVDQMQVAIASAAGIGRLRGFSRETMAHALSLAVVPAVPLRATRTGQLSDWKGFAAAHGAMLGAFACRLAAAGMTGPEAPFSGVAGLYDLLGVPRFDLSSLGARCEGRTALGCTGFKLYPAEYSSQGAIHALVAMRAELPPSDRIRRITVHLPRGGWHEIGGGQGDRDAKWNPETRESADHSMPFLAAAAVLDGRVDLRTFDAERWRDSDVRALVARVEVLEDPELTRAHAGELPYWPCRVEVEDDAGVVMARKVPFPPAHPRAPFPERELLDKFAELAGPRLGREGADALREAVVGLHEAGDLGALLEALGAAARPVGT
ncbi:hypothetical protein DFJ74DRAFT_718275 [Hyaloraphidium curvatum]|nr:hypothetical protein DFJ74DRAFT_718275 [Hyaloraphidium curvatum]